MYLSFEYIYKHTYTERPRPIDLETGTSFQFFQGEGGQNFDRLPNGGQIMKNTKFCKQKHKKDTIF